MISFCDSFVIFLFNWILLSKLFSSENFCEVFQKHSFVVNWDKNCDKAFEILNERKTDHNLNYYMWRYLSFLTLNYWNICNENIFLKFIIHFNGWVIQSFFHWIYLWEKRCPDTWAPDILRRKYFLIPNRYTNYEIDFKIALKGREESV